jgi:excisionase family DNA binding protein
VPVAGTIAGGAAGLEAGRHLGGAVGGAAGEAAAQLVEPGGVLDKGVKALNPYRMAVEGAMGALPEGAFLAKGRALNSAIRGAATAAVGTAGRRTADKLNTEGEGPSWADTLLPNRWSGSELLGVAGGGVLSGLLGKLAGPKVLPKNAPEVPKVESPWPTADELKTEAGINKSLDRFKKGDFLSPEEHAAIRTKLDSEASAVRGATKNGPKPNAPISERIGYDPNLDNPSLSKLTKDEAVAAEGKAKFNDKLAKADDKTVANAEKWIARKEREAAKEAKLNQSKDEAAAVDAAMAGKEAKEQPVVETFKKGNKTLRKIWVDPNATEGGEGATKTPPKAKANKQPKTTGQEVDATEIGLNINPPPPTPTPASAPIVEPVPPVLRTPELEQAADEAMAAQAPSDLPTEELTQRARWNDKIPAGLKVKVTREVLPEAPVAPNTGVAGEVSNANPEAAGPLPGATKSKAELFADEIIKRSDELDKMPEPELMDNPNASPTLKKIAGRAKNLGKMYEEYQGQTKEGLRPDIEARSAGSMAKTAAEALGKQEDAETVKLLQEGLKDAEPVATKGAIPVQGNSLVEPLLTKEQALEKLGVSKATLERLVKSGKLPQISIGGQIARFKPQDIANYLNKGERGGIDPKLAMALGGAAIGGATGAVADEEHPTEGMFYGALAGGAAPYAIGALPKVMGEGENLGDVAKKTLSGVKNVGRNLPSLQRFNLLSDLTGLSANTVAPWGSAMLGSVESALKLDPKGVAGIKELLKLKRLAEDVPEAVREASRRIGESERAEGLARTGSENLDTVLSGPGTIMTTGDILARNALIRAGFTEDQARKITLTSQPWSKFGNDVVNFGKFKGDDNVSSTLSKILFPFKRTAMNIVEQGAERIPGVGSIVNLAKPEGMREGLKGQLVQQGMGAAVFMAAKKLGENTDPDSARTARKFISNLSGQYAMLASAGFAAGQAEMLGKNQHRSGFEDVVGSAPAITSSLVNDLPLPTTQTLKDAVNTVSAVATGEAPHPNKEGLARWLPRAAMPGFLTNADQAETSDEILDKIIGRNRPIESDKW